MNRLQAKELSELEASTFAHEASKRLAHIFPRSTTREQSGRYIQALMRNVERKNSWQLAESLGDETPYRTQSLLGRSKWDAEKAVCVLQKMIIEKSSKQESIFILDDTGFVKKGDKSVGVQSQYCGRTGKIDNCQNGVFLAAETSAGSFLVDRRIYLPKSWTNDMSRRHEASVPEEVRYKGKGELGKDMIDDALRRGFSAEWVLGDSIYGQNRDLRKYLEERHISYVLGVPGNARIWRNFTQWKVSDVARHIPMKWKVISCGDGSQKRREFRWAFYKAQHQDLSPGWTRGFLFRQSIKNPDEISYSRVFCPQEKSLVKIIQAAGRRWKIEECFQRAKSEVGLAEYEVRSWQGWHRHTVLAMWAHAILVFLEGTVKKNKKSARRRTT